MAALCRAGAFKLRCQVSGHQELLPPAGLLEVLSHQGLARCCLCFHRHPWVGQILGRSPYAMPLEVFACLCHAAGLRNQRHRARSAACLASRCRPGCVGFKSSHYVEQRRVWARVRDEQAYESHKPFASLCKFFWIL